MSRFIHRNLGGGNNTATFTVEVGAAGDYAVNVAFITDVTRMFGVSINTNVTVQTFEFISSGVLCNEGGKSTVLPIELEGFIVGSNTITFGAGNETIEQPSIEWISVVGASP